MKKHKHKSFKYKHKIKSDKFIAKAIMQRIQSRLHIETNYPKIMSLQTHPDVEPYNKERKLRFIENFHNTLSGEIWILGCGPSLDDFPNNFFDDKISVAINWAIIRFPNSTYWWGDAPCLLFMKGYQPEIFRRTFSRFPFIPHAPRAGEEVILRILDKYRWDPICVRYKASGNLKIFEKYAGEAVNLALYGQQSFYMTHFRTSLHQVILITIYLGARQITLVGCEGKYRYGRRHASRDNMKNFYYHRETKEVTFREPLLGTECLARLLKGYGIIVKRYFYGKGYEENDNLTMKNGAKAY